MCRLVQVFVTMGPILIAQCLVSFSISDPSTVSSYLDWFLAARRNNGPESGRGVNHIGTRPLQLSLAVPQ